VVELTAAIRRAAAAWKTPHLWQQLQRNGMKQDYSWDSPSRQYLALYQRIQAE
jgi:starch synthase